MKIFLITEGTVKTGFGHLCRCIALYQAFHEKGYSPKFIVNGDASARELLQGYEVSFLNWIEELDKLYNIITDSDVVIIDSYLAGIEIYEAISEIAKKAVYIDDYIRLDYPKGIVINGTIYAEDLLYPKKEHVEYLLGREYIILRKEFWTVPNKEIKQEISKVLITFGGSDIKNLTPKLLAIISRNYSSWEKHVVIGNAFNNLEEVKKSADNRTFFHYAPNAEGMKDLMLDCDIAISAAGQTTNELARCGVPSIIIQTAENQKKNINGWQKAGFILDLLHYDSVNNISVGKSILDITDNYKIISRKGQQNVDGSGSARIVEIVTGVTSEHSLILRRTTSEDMMNLFELVNDPIIRSNSFNSNSISIEDHLKWFNEIIYNPNSLILVAEIGKEFVGQIRFDIRNNEIITNISVSSRFRGRGLGSDILIKALLILKKTWENINTVTAYIKPDNISSQKIFKKAGYKPLINQTSKNSLKFVYTY